MGFKDFLNVNFFALLERKYIKIVCFQSKFSEPRLLVAADPRIDHQSITESSYVNIPVIAFCNTDAPMSYVDIGIPCNTKGNHSLGLMWWMLAREVLRLRGTISRDMEWEVMPDLFFYRDPEEVSYNEGNVNHMVQDQLAQKMK